MSLAKPIEMHYELYGVPTNLINEVRQFLDEKFLAKSIKCGVSVNWHLDFTCLDYLLFMEVG